MAAARWPIALAHADSWAPFEVHSGTVAQALLDGVDWSFERLPIQAHVRGSAFLGFLIAPLYALFGSSALVMKLAPLLWHALTVGLLVYVLDRFFTRRSAITAGLLLLCAPPMMAKLSVLGFGSHMESSLLLVLALIPFLAITLEGRRSAGLYLLFGLLVGLAHTWHLQALLPCLLLVGLLVLHAPRRLLGPVGLAALAGILLGAAPSLLFLGLGEIEGSWDAIKLILIPEGGASPKLAESTLALGSQSDPVSKLGVLVRGGFVQILGFFEAGPRWGRWLGPLYAILLLAAASLAFVQDRARLGPRACFGRERQISPAACFSLHAVVLLALFLLSVATIYFTEISTGWPNRRLSPLLFSLLVLAALGMAGGLRRPTPRWLWLALLVPLCAAGAWGQLGAVRATEANRLQNRGDCYEWFIYHLMHHAGQDVEVLMDTIRHLDRGDARFRSLRFSLPFGELGLDRPWFAAGEARRRAGKTEEQGVYRATHVGLQLGQDVARFSSPSTWALVDATPGVYREALLHGMGQGLPRGRPDYRQHWRETMATTIGVLRELDARHVEAVAEGHGFAWGFVFDPYLDSHLNMLGGLERLPLAARGPFFRGLGWGYRQRYLDPPDHLPDGLLLVDLLPPGMRVFFEQGFLASHLPAEAQVMARAGS